MTTRASLGAGPAGIVGAVLCCVLLVGCSSSGGRSAVPQVTSTSTTSTSTAGAASNAERDALQFRLVLGTVPYGAATSTTSSPGAVTSTCGNGKAVTPAVRDIPSAQVLLADRAKSACYVLGPVLLTGHDVETAQAVVNQTTAAWEVNVHFANDDFVTKVAAPDVGKQIAIVLDRVVESAPTINSGITGRDITISGSFDEATARAIATKLS